MISPNAGSPRPLVASAIRKTRTAFGTVAMISAITNILVLTGPLFMMQVYDRVLASRSVPTLIALSVLALVLYLFLGALELIRSRILSRIGQQFEEELGQRSFASVMQLPLRSGPDVNSQPIRDLEQMRQFMSGPGPVAVCDMPWLPLYLVVLFLFHPYLGWLAIAGAAVLMILTFCSETMLREPTRRIAELANRRNQLLDAALRNAEALRAMGMTGAFARRWRQTNDLYVDEQRRTNDVINSFATASKIFRLALQSAVLALGAWLAISQMASPGAIIAASILTARALSPIEQAIGQWRAFVSARQARSRLQSLLERLRDDHEKMPLNKPDRQLVVSGLTVAAPGMQTAILRDISFALNAGQGLGVIGPSGSGKSTLARAIVGVWPAARGSVRLDGAELDHWDPEALGPSIGYLSQNVELFDGTVAENISRFAADPEPNAIISAAKTAGAHELILSLPGGYDTQIGTAGAMLSGGQRQRIGLARALFGKPFLIVLDEPNSNLDAEGELALSNAIKTARENGAIVIIVAHRSTALAAVDQVLVVAGGSTVTYGPRDEILRKTSIHAVGGKG